MLRIDTIHHYRHPSTLVANAHCRLRIYDNDDGAVVILSELADNAGISVTDTAGDLATEIAALYHLTPATTTWIEHYGPFSYSDGRRDETFDEITFSWHAVDGIFPKAGNILIARRPDWHRLTVTELLAILPGDIEVEYRLAAKWRQCPRCAGSGKIGDNADQPCPACGGVGGWIENPNDQVIGP